MIKDLIIAVFPSAQHITDVGDCDACGWGNEFFFTLPEHFKVDENGMVHGGYYCVDCGFSNAGQCPIELVSGLD